MKTIKLISLMLRNFKGAKDVTITFDGNTDIYGANESGKTTTVDAWTWLLFDKDSQNQKKFDIKTQDESGNTIHGLEHEVTAVIEVDGKRTELSKIYMEKWTKKRNQITKEFTGHTTTYAIDGVPSKKGEYEAFIKDLIDEESFKKITNPTYFNEQLHWKERRETLLTIAGDVRDQEVIASNKKLDRLSELLEGKSIEDVRKIIAAKRKEINEELERIPVRIDEINRNMPDTSDLKESDINSQLEQLNADIEAKNEQINSIQSGGEVSKLKAQISDIDLKLSQVKNQHEQDNQQLVYKHKASLQEAESNASIVQSKISNAEMRKSANNDRIQDLMNDMKQWREEWTEVNKQEFEHKGDCNCPTCGQELPEEQINEARDKAEKQFNASKAKDLESIAKKGTSAKEKVEELNQENESIDKGLGDLNKQLETAKKAIESYKSKVESAEELAIPLTENSEYKKLSEEKQQLSEKVSQSQNSVMDEVEKVRQEITPLKEKQKELQEQLSSISLSQKAKDRIKELEQQQEQLAEEFERQEEKLYLSEEFIRTKVNLLEEKINSEFSMAKFKLFNKNINGGLEETCEVMYKGVTYSNLNTAAKINIGLDIINRLSEQYGVSAPIMFDNAESVTNLIDSNAQVIRLIVSPADKKLRIENTEKVGVA
ncbi:AAA family ATPase [Oceanobacillus oncorhynchi subsp. oncorhynchi]|uniref:ATP-binding protein n=1 Tax=Oceanobacillus oncorhynchi TaxID=545501 RepID=UPI0031CE41D4